MRLLHLVFVKSVRLRRHQDACPASPPTMKADLFDLFRLPRVGQIHLPIAVQLSILALSVGLAAYSLYRLMEGQSTGRAYRGLRRALRRYGGRQLPNHVAALISYGAFLFLPSLLLIGLALAGVISDPR